MADRLATFCSILQRSVEVCDALSALYQPDAALNWANQTLMETANVRMAFADRLVEPDLDLEETSIIVRLISHYLDGHWADYIDLPKPDPAKHEQVLQLHAALQSLMEEVAPINIALRAERQAQQASGKLDVGPDVRKAVEKWLASGVNEEKLKAAMQRPDFQQTFLRLVVADKGLYQQHVILDDYTAIPGVSRQLYVSNSLPQLPVAASNFGVADKDLDLPADKAQTFTGSAKLVKLKPGDKLYRVANDPATDPFGHRGSYWTRTPPTGLAGVIGGTALMPEWNNYEKVYEFTVPEPGPGVPEYHAWEGPAASQPVSNYYQEKQANGYCLAGGDNQLFLPDKLTRPTNFRLPRHQRYSPTQLIADRLVAFCSILQRSVEVCDALSVLYAPDAALDWADRTLKQTANTRMGLADRLAKPNLDLEEAGILVSLISHYLDTHWADYIDLPKPDLAKREHVLQLHAAFQSLMEEIYPMGLELYNERQAQQTGDK